MAPGGLEPKINQTKSVYSISTTTMCVDCFIGLTSAWIELIFFKVGLKKILPTRTDGDTDSTEGVSQVYALREPAEVLQLLN